MKSNFALFFEEYEGMNTIEDDKGFATYKFIEDIHGCYIVNVFVRPEYRKDKLVNKYADQVTKVAKDKGCTLLITTVDPESNNPDRSRYIFKRYGFTYKRFYDKLEWYTKEI